jgi:hypothetical protein
LNKQPAIALGLGILSLIAAGACDNGGGGQAGANSATGVPGVDKFRQPGPEATRTMAVNGYTFFLGATNRAKPGLTWANGTGASPGSYDGLLRRVASYGVQVVASNSSSTGNGTAVAQGVGVLMNAGLNVTNRFCASGHSQGGSGCINATRMNPNIICTIPVQPDNRVTASSNGRDIRGPALILCGANDNLAPCGGASSGTNGSGLYNQASVPVVQVTIRGGTHTGGSSPTGQGAIYSALVTAHTQAVLLGDPQALAATVNRPAGILTGASSVAVTRQK